MLPVIALFLALVASSAQKAGPCTLIDRATVVALLGPTSTGGTPAGPEPDEDTGGTLRYCTFRTGASGLIVSQVNFPSAAAAAKATTDQLVSSRMEGDEAKTTEEPGLGDKAYWSYTSEGAAIVFVKGSVVLGLSMGGQLSKPPQSYHKALRAAAAAALLKL